MSKETGGSAFPSHGSMGEVTQEGMTLRDWFAGQALSALSGIINDSGPEFATRAYQIADAMIAERNKK